MTTATATVIPRDVGFRESGYDTGLSGYGLDGCTRAEHAKPRLD